MNRSIVPAFLLLSLVAPPAFGGGVGDIEVTATTDGADPNPGDGVCDDGAGACTLRAAIQTANALVGHNRVILGFGVYRLTIKRNVELPDDQTGDLDVTSDITVIGQGDTGPCTDGAGCTAIDGKKGKDRVFDVTDQGALELDDLIVRNGKAAKGDFNPSQTEEVSGGCILVEGSLSLYRVTVERCTSPDDGGCVGITDAASGSFVESFLDRCKTKDAGGAIEVDSGTLDLNKVTIANSKASAQGGGIESSGGTLHLHNVTFSRNKAKQGGALEVEGDATASVNNTTFFDNKASEGACIFTDPDSQFFAVEVSNSLLRSAKENNCIGLVDSDGGNTENGTSCEFFKVGDCTDCDPGIVKDLADNGGRVPTHAIEAGGDGINRGVATCESTDARGAARVGPCDAGSFEYGGVAP
jgi:CSLREA domain-containing protein